MSRELTTLGLRLAAVAAVCSMTLPTLIAVSLTFCIVADLFVSVVTLMLGEDE